MKKFRKIFLVIILISLFLGAAAKIYHRFAERKAQNRISISFNTHQLKSRLPSQEITLPLSEETSDLCNILLLGKSERNTTRRDALAGAIASFQLPLSKEEQDKKRVFCNDLYNDQRNLNLQIKKANKLYTSHFHIFEGIFGKGHPNDIATFIPPDAEYGYHRYFTSWMTKVTTTRIEQIFDYFPHRCKTELQVDGNQIIIRLRCTLGEGPKSSFWLDPCISSDFIDGSSTYIIKAKDFLLVPIDKRLEPWAFGLQKGVSHWWGEPPQIQKKPNENSAIAVCSDKKNLCIALAWEKTAFIGIGAHNHCLHSSPYFSLSESNKTGDVVEMNGRLWVFENGPEQMIEVVQKWLTPF